MERGALQFEYAPPRGHPILYAGMLLFGVVFVMGSIENALRQNSATLYAAYALPLLGVVLLFVALMPNTIRIFEHGIQPARPLLLRWHKPFLAFDDMSSAYPVYYDVTGAFVSPFASSDGKVTMMGIGVEIQDHLETIKFTPTRYIMHQTRSLGYKQAMPIVAAAFAQRNRSMVPNKEAIPEAEMTALLAQANAPFLPFFVIVFLLVSPAPILATLLWLHWPVWAALPIAIVPALGVMLRSFKASQDRNAILNRISKAT